jgi:hypothetical protein
MMCFPLQYTFLVFKNGNPPQLPLPATMSPKAITSVLAAAKALFLPIDGQPSDDDLVHLSDAILPILLKATYGCVKVPTISADSLPAWIGIFTTAALPLYAQPPVQCAITRQSTRNFLRQPRLPQNRLGHLNSRLQGLQGC